MKLNQSWGILSQGIPTATFEYGRKFAENVYNGALVNTLNALVPYKVHIDDMRRAFQIEELIKLIRRSTLKERFEEWDTFNTYTKSIMTYPPIGLTQSSSEDFTVSIASTPPASRYRVEGYVTGGNALAFHNYSANYKDQPTPQVIYFSKGQSNALRVKGVDITMRFRGPIASSFSFGFEIVSPLHMDWNSLLVSLENTSHNFVDKGLKDIWNSDTSWVERISAYTFSVLTQCLKG